MFSFLKKDPSAKLNKQYEDLLKKAVLAQRNGDIRTYSQLTTEAQELASRIDSLKITD